MSSFLATCNRLSQFIKENKMGLSAASSMAMDLSAAACQPPVTKNLLQCLDVPLVVDDQRAARLLPQQAEEIKSVQQLTIFYGGKLLVFDDFPADKAKLLMGMATTTTPSIVAPAASIACPPAGELALTGRRSLRRFFEKRKDRINSKGPYYPLDGSSCSLPANKAEVFSQSQHALPRPWLDLNHQATPLS